ncbi:MULTISPECIES: glycosyltransferase family 4 protein [Deefgea]|uniref:Glycosyltransferase n=1 Tax=Deefgea chitinilytica TaxID=570276 RepID=A0ABS2CE10_9NEIS|nr:MULTISPECIES: glycosyltransferase family 4 protein [Deefgea]MBM5572354.1 glycosyltransferase [Deefgea chitinilytica]MBM9889590.1 glycosyltransferase family 4 protein [Deefgea sp. CFH1-16]
MSLLRVLVVHNAYQHRGGEDSVVDTEIAMLRSRGHEVALYQRHNDDVAGMSKIELVRSTFWSPKTLDDIALQVRDFRPDVIHVHNTFPLISPSVYQAAHLARIPVIQTLHNFRLLCPQAMFLRDGKVCEDCLGKSPWRAVTRRCYRGSVAQSGVLAGMLVFNRFRGVYVNKVSKYITLSSFAKAKFVHGGLPASRFVIKPNFVPDLAVPDYSSPRNSLLFVGRLSEEKGLSVLAQAFNAKTHGVLRVAGTGTESAQIEGLAGVEMLGALKPLEVRAQMDSSLALVLPSICYENMPMTLLEAYAAGLPVIGSRLGALVDLIEDGVTGLLFEPSDPVDLQAKLTWAVQNPEAMLQMGKNARSLYLEKYTPEQNYAQLIKIYQTAIDEKKGALA